MRFLTYLHENEEHIGFIENDIVYKVNSNNMIDVIKSYKDIDFESIKKDIDSTPIEKVKVMSPIVKPVHDIICVGKNYKDHIVELGFDIKEKFTASYFGKRAIRIMGPNENIKGRFDLDRALDYEVELAVVIGKECKNIKKEDALEYVFGFTIFNDLSSRNIQMDHGQWFRGKSLDEYSIMGPYLVTKDEVDYNNLQIKSYVNGELRQDSNTSNMIIKIEEIIEELSSAMTLEPGDIISTGTPDGVGLGYTPPNFLKSGDNIRCEIEGLGSLYNEII